VVGPTQVCVWREMLDKLPTRIYLVRRGVNVPNNICLLCRNVEETTQHIFINCEVTQNVWDNRDRWLGMSFVRHNNIVNHF